MSRTDTWMPLYIGDYMADTMHLSGAEHGAYLLLLMHSWRTGPLRDDARTLATIARTEPAAWKRMAPTILAFFDRTDAGLVNPRLEREREKAAQNTDQRSAAGKAGAAKRWRKDGGEDGEGGQQPPPQDGGGNGGSNAAAMRSPMANGMRSLWQNDGPSPSPSEKSSESKNSRAVSAVASPAASPPPDARMALWTEGLDRLRRLTGKPDKAARAMLGQFCRAAGDDCALVASLLHEAEAARVGDPVPWLNAAIRTRTGERSPTAKPGRFSFLADAMFGPEGQPSPIIDVTAERVA
jgi:uncharacterized protein YdaU (DUF1376 family)